MHLIPYEYHLTPDLTEAIASAQTGMFSKLMKPKSRIEMCQTMIWEDEEYGNIEIYYRKINAPISPQTDECEDQYTIEAARINGEPFDLPSNIEQSILIHLEENKK